VSHRIIDGYHVVRVIVEGGLETRRCLVRKKYSDGVVRLVWREGDRARPNLDILLWPW